LWTVPTNLLDGIHQSAGWHPPVHWTASTNLVDGIHQSGGRYPPICWTVPASLLDGIRQSAGRYPPVHWTVSTNLVDYTRQSGRPYPRITWVWEVGVVGEGGGFYFPETSFICSKDSLYSFFRFCLNLNPKLFNKNSVILRVGNELNAVLRKSLEFITPVINMTRTLTRLIRELFYNSLIQVSYQFL
jgi:hypothetical protein